MVTLNGFETLYIPAKVLEKLKDEDWFINFVKSQYINTAAEVALLAELSDSFLLEAYGQWMNDVRRIKDFELDNNTEPDHFKQAGHLTYWLRRSRPVVDVRIVPSAVVPEGELAAILHELIMIAPNEYLAFDIGYRIVLLHECYSVGAKRDESEFALTDDFVVTMVQFLRNKNVSPHALFLIFKSLFLR